MPLTASDLHVAIQVVAPTAKAVRIKRRAFKGTWVVMFTDGSEWNYGAPTTTPDEQAAEAVIRDWDFAAPAPPTLEERAVALDRENRTLRNLLVRKGVVTLTELEEERTRGGI